MGNTTSVAGRECLLSAVGGNRALVAFPDDPLYQATAVHPYNLNYPVTPAAVTYPETSEQVAAIVKCADKYDCKVQGRSGGHNYANFGLGGNDGAVVVDVKHFQQFAMDEYTHVATIGAGTRLRDVDARLYNAGGRAMSHGVCPDLGAGGHFTIGGSGPTARQWGLAVDHILEVEMVLADSRIVRASETENADLFFAVRGAAASFGIITEFKVRTELAPDRAVQYSYAFNLGSTAEKAQLFKDWQALISDPDLTPKLYSTLTVLPESILLTGVFFGSKAEYEAFGLEDRFPIQNPGNVVVLTDWLGIVGDAFQDLVVNVGNNIPMSFVDRGTGFTRDTLLSSSGIDELFEYLDTANKGTPLWFVTFLQSGAAISQTPRDATAYPHRDILFWMESLASTLVLPVTQTPHDFLDGLMNTTSRVLGKPVADLPVYPGFVDPELPDPQRAYWGENLPRLERIKAAVDPKDVFHNPQSVRGRA
ncbi:FAD/FMN-containing dehydrogenase [Aspergillus steynii IBT 23096]|uniref:FAD/FMN-containing dehydrogenase n=1 Tax=Aspergillus steynii IBT 23096 TaxID=1392250 RepID=A0A2I2GNX4_9EURO|nr:FAD/FMN-containing dehydrogenase [Aspergillus steynii IBT 23096]PLB54572.1 FAD/FMN-containing dehydrogenase [Aspergillus steynii IBT 23096]